jgi:hypothetical protein
MLQANGFEQVRVLDSISATHAAAAAAASPANAQHAGITAAGIQQQPVAPSSHHTAGDSGTAAGQPAAAASEVKLRILVASKGWGSGSTAGSSTPQPAAAAADMRPDNVAQWFTTPGLAGLADVAMVGGAGAAEQAAGSNPSAAASSDIEQQLQQQQQLDVSAAFSDARLLQQWVASYEVLVGDAAELGIPRSVIPQLGPQPSPGEVQAAVAHLQAMVASFLSAGL